MRDHTPLPSIAIEQQPEPTVCRMTVIGEAWGEQDVSGRLESIAMLGVLWTGDNRRTDRRNRWPKTLRQVFLQPWQFSCFNEGSAVRSKLLIAHSLDKVSWERADTICDLFESGYTIDPTRGATHYCRVELWGLDDAGRERPRWHSAQEIEAGRTVQLVQLGSHVFGRAA